MGSEELPEWATEMDREILEVLSSELVLTPAIIAENINRFREAVSRRLNTLEAGELVEKIDRGKYRISDEAFFIVAESVEISEEAQREAIQEEQNLQKAIEDELGITREEYQKSVEEEYRKIINEDKTVSTNEALRRAFSQVDKGDKYTDK